MLETIPLGAIFFGWCVLMAVAPIRRPRVLALASWASSNIVIELPFLFLYIVVASTVPTVVGGLSSAANASSLAIGLLTAAGLVIVVRRALLTRTRVQQALDQALGATWRADIDPSRLSTLRKHLPWARILLVPWGLRPRDVERVRDIAYGDNGTSNLLNVYHHRSHPSRAPTLIYLHGGHFRWGRKSREARPLIHYLARQGWTCISANYHLAPTPAAGFPQHLIDVKKVIAWARSDGLDHGVDPDTVFLVGGSAGAHLTAMVALTANDPTLQPGFEAADTSIIAGIGLYGYYGPLDGDPQSASSPLAHIGPQAPPFFVIHGDNDTYTPVEGARLLVDRMRASSSNPVAYAELPGAQHSFDLFHSIRFDTIVDAIEAFAVWVRTQHTHEHDSSSHPSSEGVAALETSGTSP